MHNLDQGYRYGFMFMPGILSMLKNIYARFHFGAPRENSIGKVENNVARKAAAQNVLAVGIVVVGVTTKLNYFQVNLSAWHTRFDVAPGNC